MSINSLWRAAEREMSRAPIPSPSKVKMLQNQNRGHAVESVLSRVAQALEESTDFPVRLFVQETDDDLIARVAKRVKAAGYAVSMNGNVRGGYSGTDILVGYVPAETEPEEAQEEAVEAVEEACWWKVHNVTSNLQLLNFDLTAIGALQQHLDQCGRFVNSVYEISVFGGTKVTKYEVLCRAEIKEVP